MKTLNEIIADLKKEHPKLTEQTNGEIFELTTADYQAKIKEWAESRFEKQSKITEAEAKASAKSALLEKLGISEDEARLLIG